MPRLYITGTDTNIGKTRVAAAIARVLRESGEPTTVVKLVQTGLAAHEVGDAQTAADLAGCNAVECRRFTKPADPWTAAREAREECAHVGELVAALAGIAGSIVVEGSGGVAVPLNETEMISDVAAQANLEAVVVVGLKLGCISHTRLTTEYLARRRIPLVGIVLCECQPLDDPAYAGEVEHALRSSGTVLGTLPFDADAAASVRNAAAMFSFLRKSHTFDARPHD